MFLEKFLIFNMGGIKLPKEQVSSIYQWPNLPQHLLQKQLYMSMYVVRLIQKLY